MKKFLDAWYEWRLHLARKEFVKTQYITKPPTERASAKRTKVEHKYKNLLDIVRQR